MSVPALSLILFCLLCAGLFTRSGHIHFPLRSALPALAAVLLLAGTFPIQAQQWTEVGTYEGLRDALDAGGHVRLTSDIPVPIGLSNNGTNDTTLDLSGKKIIKPDTETGSPDILSVLWLDTYQDNRTSMTLQDSAGGGTITGGNVINTGGGIYATGRIAIKMEGGTITGNNAGQRGGGAYIAMKTGTFSMSGGTITGNTAPKGGGVYLEGGIFELSCGETSCPEISGNTTQDGKPSNLYLSYCKKIDITGPLTAGSKKARIGISVDCLGIFTNGLKGHGDASNFFSDDPDYEVKIDAESGEAMIVLKSAAAPEFSPDPGDGPFISSLDVTITSGTAGASIYYTTNGDTPTKDSTLYKGPVTITKTTTIKAIAVKDGMSDSEAAEAKYTVTEADYTLTVGGLDFGGAAYGYRQPDPKALTIKNNGNADASIVSVQFSGGADSAFDLTAGTDSVAAGETNKTWTVRPKAGLDAKAYKEKVIVTYDIGTKAAEDLPAAEADVSFTVKKKEVTVTAKDQKISEGGSIETGIGQADLADALDGHTLSAVTLTAEGSKITASEAKIQDGDKKDVTDNYEIRYEPGTLAVTGTVRYQVTFKVVNGAWNDNTLEDKTVTLSGPEGSELKLAVGDIPEAGNSPDAGFTAGSWDTEPDTDTEITGDVTYTYTYQAETGPEPEREQRLNFFRVCEDCKLPATGFSSVRPTALSEQPAALRYEPVRMRLMLPTLEEDIELVTLPREGNTWAADWLGADAGILEGSDIPGRGMAVIAAHNTLNDTTYGPFAMLATMEKGDRIFVTGGDGELLSFEVYANELVEPDGLAAIEALAEENALVLLTCENEAIGGGYLNRRAVFAK